MTMTVQTATQTHHLTLYDLLWRLLLTTFLLLMLAGPGLTAFTAVTTAPTAHALPTLEVIVR